MVATKIIELYSTIWIPILKDEVAGLDVIEFAQKLPELRRALTCSVCDQLMTNREVISPSGCLEHFACKACRGRDRGADKKCQKCEDWNTFEKNETLDIILKSYQRFCWGILTCEKIERLLEVKHEVDPNFDPHALIDLLAEGVRGALLPEPKKKPPIEVLKEGRGIIPIPIRAKRAKKVPLKDDNESNIPKTSSSESVASAVTKGGESTSDEGLNMASSNDLGDKIVQQQGVSEQPDTSSSESEVSAVTNGGESTLDEGLNMATQIELGDKIVQQQGVSEQPDTSSSESEVSAVTNGGESTLDEGLSMASQNDLVGDKIVQQQGVNEQMEEVTAKAPPLTTTVPVPSKPLDSTAMQQLLTSNLTLTTTVPLPGAKSGDVYLKDTKSNFTFKVINTFPLPPNFYPGSSPGVATSPPVVEKSAPISSPVAISAAVSSPVAKSVTSATAGSSGVPVIMQEAHDVMRVLPDMSVSFEPESPPRKNSEEDYDSDIQVLSPPESPVKLFPASASNVTTAPIISSSPAAAPTMNSSTPFLTTSAQRLAAPQYVQFCQADKQWKVVSIEGQHFQPPPNFGSLPAGSAGSIPVPVFKPPEVPMSGSGIINAPMLGSGIINAPMLGSGIINAGGCPSQFITMQEQQPATNPSASGASSKISVTVSGGPDSSPETILLAPVRGSADPTKPLRLRLTNMIPVTSLRRNVLSVAAHPAPQAQMRASLPSTSGTFGTSGTITNVGSTPAAGSLVHPMTGLLRQPIAGTSQSMTNVQFVGTSVPGNAEPAILQTEGLASTQAPTVPSQVTKP